ncbi:endonuclease [Bacillaceae bacterium SAOS 7]|nr:endonuclease [Bacillaceae bacterium SAOS 7]
MKKHWMFGSALLSLGLILSACGDEETNSAEPKQEVAEEKPTSQDETKTQESNSEVKEDSIVKKDEPKEEEKPANAVPAGLIKATVESVTDGDTIKVNMDGKKETVRLILVDTPETKHPRTGVQPFGPEASEFTTEQLSGKEIQIEPGIEERDRYGRLLAYVYIGDKMFNKMLLEQGLARVAVYPPNTQYLDEMKEIESTAKNKQLGIWSIENYVTEDGYKTEEKEEPAPAPQPETKTVSEPELEPVQEPEPTPESVEEPTATYESYKNCTELRKVHPDGVPSSHPAYESKHDRDKDDWACER